MLKIGDFSKLAHVTVKTLRHYARLGLLQPTWTDRFSGYRYYLLEQLTRLNRILALKDLGFSLVQIRALLDAEISPAVLRQMFNQRQDELQEHLLTEQAQLKRVAERLQQIDQEGCLSGAEVTVKTIPVQWIVSQRTRLSETDDLRLASLEVRRRISSLAAQAGLRPTRQWLVLSQASEYTGHEAEVEVGLVLAEGQVTHQHVASLTFRRMEAVESMASLLVVTDEQPIQEAYSTLYRWSERNGYAIAGPSRQVLLDEPSPAQEAAYLELQVPVESATVRRKKYLSNPHRKESEMEPTFVTRPAFTVVGMRYFGKNQNQEISHMWSQANQRFGEIHNPSPKEEAYGICMNVPGAQPGEFEYVAGLEVTKVEDVPDGYVVREVPAQKYAVFTHVGSLEQLKATYDYIYQTWLPQSGNELTGGPDFELYNEEFKNFSPDSRFYIYVPLK